MLILLSLAWASTDAEILDQVRAAAAEAASAEQREAACVASDDWSHWEACSQADHPSITTSECREMGTHIAAICTGERQAAAIHVKQQTEEKKVILAVIGTTGESDAGLIADMFNEADLGSLDEALADAGGVTTEPEGGIHEVDPETGEGHGISGVDALTPEEREVPALPSSVVTLADSGNSEAITVQFKRRASVLKRCHERRLQVHPDLTGAVTVVVTTANGRVDGIEVTDTPDDELGNCVMQGIRRWRFPLETEGTWKQTIEFGHDT